MLTPFAMKLVLVLLSVATTAAFHPRPFKFIPVPLHVSQGSEQQQQQIAAPIPTSFDPFAFDGVDENWSTSFNNPFVMAAYGRYLETGVMDPFLEQVLVARLRRMEKQVTKPEEVIKDHYPDLPPNLSEDERRRQLWMEGERRRQLELEQRMKEPKKPKATRWVQGPSKPAPALSDPRSMIEQVPRVPPAAPPSRPY